jgi:hypothetical protein
VAASLRETTDALSANENYQRRGNGNAQEPVQDRLLL